MSRIEKMSGCRHDSQWCMILAFGACYFERVHCVQVAGTTASVSDLEVGDKHRTQVFISPY